MRFAKTVSIEELKRSLASLVDEAAAGARILITKGRYLEVLDSDRWCRAERYYVDTS